MTSYDFKKQSKEMFSNITSTKVRYLQTLLWVFFSTNFLLLSVYLIFDAIFVEYLLLPVCLSIIHSSIIYLSFKNSAILSKDEFESNYTNNNEVIKNTETKNKITLTEEELANIETVIRNELNSKSSYKNPEISLSKLAALMDIPSYKISITLNEKMDTTFYDLINSKRVEASLSLLQQNKNLTIEAIGSEVGFKSKSTFYRALKKHKGTTPTDFISKS
jgi:YesN/AraC family two-component response regulator